MFDRKLTIDLSGVGNDIPTRLGKIRPTLTNQLSSFENDEKFDEKISRFEEIIELIKNGKTNLNEIDDLIDDIDFHMLPKSIKYRSNEKDKTQKGIFLTNNKSSKKYTQKGVNYFIDAPIELHLISVIWVMKAGFFIDANSSKSCYWFRLNEKLSEPEDHSSHIFKLYHEQYAAFRDNSIQVAELILKEEHKEIAILSLDLKHCFYSITINFDEIIEFLKTKIKNKDELDFAIALTNILKEIHRTYRKKIDNFFICSHNYIARNPERCVIPIGLASSGILCNWHLKKFDKEITTLLKPAYYGRYIDDIIIVIKNPEIKKENKIQKFMETYFLKSKILDHRKIDKKTGYYFINSIPDVIISDEKLTLFHLTPDHSLAMLENFKRKINENSSAFSLLPDRDLKYFINNSSYQLSFNGSSNKLRNITNVTENATALSINLTQIIAMLNISKPSNEILQKISDQLITFYKGENFINFYRLWEKLFTFSIISKQYSLAAKFYIDIQETIGLTTEYLPEKINTSQKNEFDVMPLLERQRLELQNYLDISISTPLGLLGLDSDIYYEAHSEESLKTGKDQKQVDEEKLSINTYSIKLRGSNLVRHNYISYPLINYSNYDFSLLDWNKIEEQFAISIFSLDKEKIELSPRYLHYDEFYLFSVLQRLFCEKKIDIGSIINQYQERYKFDLPISIKNLKRTFETHDEVRSILIENFHIAENVIGGIKFPTTVGTFSPVLINLSIKFSNPLSAVRFVECSTHRASFDLSSDNFHPVYSS
ncbi:MAG: RNA-directed DNA polymerase [Methanoregula sp.]|nr:RNA-directed DNA polymerase [Methanoregula sp.]